MKDLRRRAISRIKTDRKLAKETLGKLLNQVGKALKKSEGSDKKGAAYSYLAAIYQAAERIFNAPRRSHMCLALGAKVHSDGRFAGILAALLHRDNNVDRKLISKRVRALMLAKKNGKASKNVERFIRKKGGFNACAAEWAQLKRHAHAADGEGRRKPRTRRPCGPRQRRL